MTPDIRALSLKSGQAVCPLYQYWSFLCQAKQIYWRRWKQGISGRAFKLTFPLL